MLNLDCDHYINNSKAIKEAMCFMMDPLLGKKVCYVQFPQRFDGIDRHDRYANRNVVFFDVWFVIQISKKLSCLAWDIQHTLRFLLTFHSCRSTWKAWMVFKGPFMLVLDASSEGRHYMAMMPPKQRSHHQGLATAGQSGAFAVAVLVTGRPRRRPRHQSLNLRR